eukprot:scaffold31815_cov118-Isochrysis_galbana.AAC.1
MNAAEAEHGALRQQNEPLQAAVREQVYYGQRQHIRCLPEAALAIVPCPASPAELIAHALPPRCLAFRLPK